MATNDLQLCIVSLFSIPLLCLTRCNNTGQSSLTLPAEPDLLVTFFTFCVVTTPLFILSVCTNYNAFLYTVFCEVLYHTECVPLRDVKYTEIHMCLFYFYYHFTVYESRMIKLEHRKNSQKTEHFINSIHKLCTETKSKNYIIL